jgi:UDP-N-acetylglucosamine 2-epimerase (non-hydrolysing)
MNIIHVVGARPNFMKVSPVIIALSLRKGVTQNLVHTGQHYDDNMSEVFFTQLGLSKPDINLGVGSGSHAQQTARIMIQFEKVLEERRSDLVLVYGDVNSTLAASIVCTKMNIPVGHVEAGLRSYDRSMPEEVNRVLTDHVADILFTPSADADENLRREGIDVSRVHCVGNVMIDTLVRLRPKAEQVWQQQATVLGLREGQYGLVTIHRASNVDDPKSLLALIETLAAVSSRIPIIFPVHPRTRERLASLTFDPRYIQFIEPVGYLEFLSLQSFARFVITDSGGIQEETTYLGVPCITMRKNTERPITLRLGTNILIGEDLSHLSSIIDEILAGRAKQGTIPPLWDGKASERIADCLENLYSGNCM